MAARINGKLVVHSELEFGVEFDSGFIYTADDEDDAQIIAQLTGGEIKVRDIVTTAWADLEE